MSESLREAAGSQTVCHWLCSVIEHGPDPIAYEKGEGYYIFKTWTKVLKATCPAQFSSQRPS